MNDTSIFRLELPGRLGTIPTVGSHKSAQPESKCPELLANYCDMLLRKTPLSKKLTSDEVEAKLKDVLLVLKYVQNKDVFMIYTKAHLTRRLILGTSADSEKEENMVEWLREVGMPADFINKLSRWVESRTSLRYGQNTSPKISFFNHPYGVDLALISTVCTLGVNGVAHDILLYPQIFHMLKYWHF